MNVNWNNISNYNTNSNTNEDAYSSKSIKLIIDKNKDLNPPWEVINEEKYWNLLTKIRHPSSKLGKLEPWGVCLSEEEDETLFQCWLCYVWVHQTCYRRELSEWKWPIKWYCCRCRALIAKIHNQPNRRINNPKCKICRQTTGVMVFIPKFRWVHILWVNWDGHAYFDDYRYKLGRYFDILWPERKWIYCLNVGVCIKCDYNDCTKYYHAYCAVLNNAIKPYYIMDMFRENEDGELPTFWKLHVDRLLEVNKKWGLKDMKDWIYGSKDLLSTYKELLKDSTSSHEEYKPIKDLALPTNKRYKHKRNRK